MDSQYFTAAEQDAIQAARGSRDQCVCDEIHDDGDSVAPATIARMKAYLAGHPGHQFVVDEEAGIIAVVIAPATNASGPLQILAQSADLLQILDYIGAPASEILS